MRLKIDAGEWYPVYSLDEPDSYGGYEVEVTEQQTVRWAIAMDEFRKAQDEMGEIYKSAQQVARERALIAKAEQEAADKAVRLERQRRTEQARRAYRAAATRTLGTVYDAEGNPVGEVEEGSMGLTIKPLAAAD